MIQVLQGSQQHSANNIIKNKTAWPINYLGVKVLHQFYNRQQKSFYRTQWRGR